MKLVTCKNNQPIGVLLAVEHVKEDVTLTVEEGQANNLVVNGNATFNSPASILRYLARAAPAKALYGADNLQRSEVDHWLEFSYGRLSCVTEAKEAILYLDHVLGPITFLVGHSVTLADIAVWGTLRGSQVWTELLASGTAPKNVARFYNFLAAQEKFVAIDKKMPQIKAQPKKPQQKERKEEGKFIDLPGAEKGKVVVRFPPEASGYLHVGHAKAALLNQYYQVSFEGKLVMRFDDTNPAKESSEFEAVILEDLKMLGIKPDVFTHTSDSFDLILSYGEKMIAAGTAYCDNTDPEMMKKEREERFESKHRSNTPEQNFAMWEEMKKGTEEGQKCCVRAKIDMKSDNGCMRDPTIFRCKNETHVRTGTKYKVYPTYDFACPIVDSVEGITHALRTTEYHDRDVQFYWFIDQLGLRKPYIWEYARLNLQNTVMSKRKLTWFVNEGLVDGWDDPRFPTVRGVLRRGMSVEGLKQFVIAQGSSRSVVMMDWEKIWSFNKKVIDPVAPRYTALQQAGAIEVRVSGVGEEKKQVQKHPKNVEVGMKDVWYGPKVMIEGADAVDFTEGENVTFINWGNLVIKKIHKSDGKVTSIDADQNLTNTDFKKTMKVTWLSVTDRAALVPTVCVYYDNIITKPVLSKEDNFKDFVNRDTKTETEMLGDPMLASLKKGDVIQLQRKGFFICDSPYEETSRYSGRHSPVVLINIPDGHVKDVHQAGSKHKGAPPAKATKTPKADPASAKEKAQSKKGKQAEKSPQEEQSPPIPGSVAEIDCRIKALGDNIRNLKARGAPRNEIEVEVACLLALKKHYKSVTGTEWKPSATQAPASNAPQSGGTDAAAIDAKITAQGNKVREIKGAKAPKDEVQAAVKVLLDLKAEYKKVTGQDWKAGASPAPAAKPAAVATPPAGSEAAAVDAKITDQGNKVRDLKGKKASKDEVQAAVKVLLDLKAEYKKVTGQDWKAGASPAPAAKPAAVATPSAGSEAAAIDAKITDQGNKVRDLKGKKASKDEVQAAVKVLLDLKAEYKKVAGQDWKAGASPAPAAKPATAATPSAGSEAAAVDAKITDQGNKVRDLKGKKASKDEVQAAVKVLLNLKAEFKKVTGLDWKPSALATSTPEAAALDAKVTEQGNKIRDIKAKKAPKDEIQAEVKVLLGLKDEYKKVTGLTWKPAPAPPPAAQQAPPAAAATPNPDGAAISAKITEQGNIVRDLKGQKAPKDQVQAAVKILLDLKGDYKNATGHDWKPDAQPTPAVVKESAPVMASAPATGQSKVQ